MAFSGLRNPLSPIIAGFVLLVGAGQGSAQNVEPSASDSLKARAEAERSLGSEARHPREADADAGSVLSPSSCGAWLKIIPPYNPALNSVAFNGSRWVAVGSKGDVEYSDDGQTWSWKYTGVYKTLSAVKWFSSRFVGVGADGVIVSSGDGRTWTQQGSPTASELRALASNGSALVAVGRAGTIIRTVDGVSWSPVSSPTANDIFAVTAFLGRFLATDSVGRVFESVDGLSWFQRTTLPSFPQYGAIMGMGANNTIALAAGYDVESTAPSKGIIYYTTDGQSWTKVNAANNTLRGVGYGAGKWVAVGDSTILESPDGRAWSSVPTPLTDRIWEVLWGQDRFVAVGWLGIATSACTAPPAPVANFTWTPQTPLVGQVVQFNDTSTGNPTSWSWDFGDGRELLGPSPTWTFTQAGTYLIALTVSNASGGSTISKQVTVTQTSALSYWVPVASHASGAGGSQWRTDLGVLNTGGQQAGLELRLYAADGIRTSTSFVPPFSQAILRDVVGQIGYSGSAALEVRSDQTVRVTSRTYNLVSASAACNPNGTFGQNYPAVSPSRGLASGQSAFLGHLTENAESRCNIGLVNTGTTTANVTVTLFDGAGAQLATYAVTLPPGSWRQENRPFFTKGYQSSMSRGYARVTVESGDGIFAFASVIDSTTGDPTTIEALR